MEHFIDKYIPIRIQKLIGESINAIASSSQLTRMQNFEMEKYKRLNEDLLNDEQHPELIDLMRTVGEELDDTIQKFKAIAKAKGVRYKVATRMKDAILSKILNPALESALSKDQTSSQVTNNQGKDAAGSSSARLQEGSLSSMSDIVGDLTTR